MQWLFPLLTFLLPTPFAIDSIKKIPWPLATLNEQRKTMATGMLVNGKWTNEVYQQDPQG
ncbi:MAG: hypothetical protein F6K38_41965, partial [Moorea sp. SIO3B2]|nr:hypothetical protein [Moorena sp. SIO3B2]